MYLIKNLRPVDEISFNYAIYCTRKNFEIIKLLPRIQGVLFIIVQHFGHKWSIQMVS